MPNIDRAAGLLWIPEPHLSVSECDDQARELAQVLAAAGLLMPDPPEPDNPTIPEWECSLRKFTSVRIESVTGDIRISGATSGYSSIQARWVAYALLAAADYAERNQE